MVWFGFLKKFYALRFQLWVKDNCVITKICQDVVFARKQSELYSRRLILGEVSEILHKGEPNHINEVFTIKALFCIKIHISAEFTLKLI